MEQVNRGPWPFDVSEDSAVVTTKYITQQGAPILLVSHESDDEEGVIWQFHSGNNDYSDEVLQLVRLDEILGLDETLYEVASLPLGCQATRPSATANWVITKA